MKIKDRVYVSFSSLLPRTYKEYMRKLLIYGGDDTSVENWLGAGNLLGILILIGTYLFSYVFYGEFKPLYLIFGLIGYIFAQFFVYITIYFKAEDRRQRIENTLPDALQLISSNLKAGMTPYQALKLATRKEFGPLAEEIEYATSQALGTESFASTLLRISERTNSEVLDRALKLFTSAMKSGGHLAQMLKELAEDIAQTKQLKDDLVTNTKTYTAFILFTIIVGAPLLLAISVYFVDVITGMQAGQGDVGFGLDFLAGEVSITVDFLVKVSIAMLIITSVLASMLLGVIMEGKEQQGFKYAPVIAIGSLVMFYVARFMINFMFGNLL